MYQITDSPSPPPQPTSWAPYATYHPGAVVWCEGTFWRCDMTHTSGAEPNGTPRNNPRLWSWVHGEQGQNGQQSFPPPSYQSFAGPSNSYNSHTPVSSGQPDLVAPVPLGFPQKAPSPDSGRDSSSSGETVTANKDGHSKSSSSNSSHSKSRGSGSNRWDSEFFVNKASESLRYLTLRQEEHKAKDKDELKDELKGKRVWRVGGVGMWSYSLDEGEEGGKRELWRNWGGRHGKDEWINAAKERTEFYERDSRGVKPLFRWKLVDRGGHMPYDALPIGHEDNGQVLYAARAWWERGLHLGKVRAGAHLVNGASISYAGDELTLDIYEVLCGPADPTLLKWMTFRHGERSLVQGWQPVEGGRESDGSAILLAKGEYENGDHPGKCLINDDHACVGWGGGEVWVRPFQVLAYSTTNRR